MPEGPGDEGKVELKRTLGLWAITVYAIGDILGAGIYALVGKVVGFAGAGAWLSFLFAGLLAVLTGLTYAELSARLPLAAGAAAYCKRAFRSPLLGFLIGFFVLASGITSAATISRAFVGYLSPFFAAPEFFSSIALLALMTLVNLWGIQESARINFAMTLAEFSGLVVVMVVGFGYASHAPASELLARVTPSTPLSGVLGGAGLAFFAFIGFEDTVNVAEEVKNPSRTLPRAILSAIALTSLVYISVTLAALFTVPRDRLAASRAPLLEVLAVGGMPVPAGIFSTIAILSISNTGLLNLIMASRLLYGMAREELLPSALGRVHPRRRTPWVAALVAFVTAVALSVSGGIEVLAQTTSFLLICVFTVVHVALLVLKRAPPPAGEDLFRAPAWSPLVGALLCVFLGAQYPAEVYLRALLVLAMGLLLFYMVQRGAIKPIS